jgi:hypothetical protein
MLILVLLFLLSRNVVSFEAAAPWTAPAGSVFLYENLENDLPALAKCQSSPHNWISLITMTAAVKRFVLNCLYSLHKYGGHKHYIVAAFDEVSLKECKQLKMPCYNASNVSSFEIEDGEHICGSRHAVEMWWSKQRIALSLLKMGYNVHGTDADVVFLRNMNLSYSRIFKHVGPDGIFAAEEGHLQSDTYNGGFINMINAGVYALISNNRTINFMHQWLGGAGTQSDQAHLNNINTQAYHFCDSGATCQSVKNHNYTAIFRHPHFWPGNSCIQPNLGDDKCDPRRLYVHFLCHVGWTRKADSWDQLNVWFIDKYLQPMWADGGGPANASHPFLPCAVQEAWPEIDGVID